MTDIDDWGMDGDQADGAGAGPPVIDGGLLDPRTFPSPWPPAPTQDQPQATPPSPDQDVHAQVLQDILDAQAKLPPIGTQRADDAGSYSGYDLQRLPPAITGPLDTDIHAEVLKDIQNAQARLPPLRLHLAGDGGFRHIDPYPGMNRTLTGGNPPLTQQAATDFLNGVPLSSGAFGPHITFVNDEAGKPSPDVPVTNALANMVEQGVVDSGFHSVNINSSVRPLKPGSLSNHPPGNAVDINNIDGFRVIKRPDLATRLQDVFARQPQIHENFGPGYQVNTVVPGQPPLPWPKVKEGHQNHDHFSAR
jgi:hypothetical protein